MGLPGDARIGRVGLSVADTDRVASFYEDVTGLARQRTDEGVALGAGGGSLVVLRPAPDVDPRPPDAAGLFHLALRYPDRAALGARLRPLREDRHLTGASDHLVSEALYTTDPEDNGVECYRDRPREDWTRTADGGVEMDTLPLDLDDLAAEAGPDAPATAPPGTDLGHVHLEVTDLDRARAFYVDALGFEVMERFRGALFVAAGGYHHHVGLNVWNDRSRPSSGRGLDWFEVELPDAGARAAAADRLRDAGYEVRRTDGAARDAVAATDPAGIEVRLVVP